MASPRTHGNYQAWSNQAQRSENKQEPSKKSKSRPTEEKQRSGASKIRTLR